jgi:4-carboxymuconolactone decarboxylase
MPTERERLDYLNEIARSRGYAHRYHRLMVNYDLDLLRAVNSVPDAVYVERRRLGEPLKELLLVVSFSCLRTARYILQAHMLKALSHGATARQLLEALEMIVLDAGRAAFENGVMAWAESAVDGGPEPATAQSRERRMESNQEGHPPGGDEARAEAPVMAFETVLAAHDPRILELVRRIPHAVYSQGRSLDAKTKELISIVMLTSLKAPEYLLKGHIRNALGQGVPKEEILEAIELIIPVTGLPTFEYGLMAWADVVGAEGLEPEGAVFSRLG